MKVKAGKKMPSKEGKARTVTKEGLQINPVWRDCQLAEARRSVKIQIYAQGQP